MKKGNLGQLLSSSEGVVKKPRLRGLLRKRLRKILSPILRGDVKDENKDQVKPSVVLDKSKGLDAHVPVTNGNIIDFQNLQGLINIHFHFHNK